MHLGFGVAIWNQIFFWNAKLFANFHNRFHFGFTCDFDVASNGHVRIPFALLIWVKGCLVEFAYCHKSKIATARTVSDTAFHFM